MVKYRVRENAGWAKRERGFGFEGTGRIMDLSKAGKIDLDLPPPEPHKEPARLRHLKEIYLRLRTENMPTRQRRNLEALAAKLAADS